MMVLLGDVAVISTGYPFRKKVESEESGDLVLLQIKDLDVAEGADGSGVIRLNSSTGKYRKYLLKDGDLLFQCRGSRHPVAVVKPGLRGIAASGLHTIRPDSQQVLPEYVAWWLNHPNSQAKLREDLARGSYIPFVSKSDLAGFQIAVPPLTIQHKIVAIEQLRREERALNDRLMKRKQDLVDGATWAAATGEHSRKKDHE